MPTQDELQAAYSHHSSCFSAGLQIVAAASDRIAIWTRSQHGRQWKVHSTLSTGFPVASLSVSDSEYMDRLKRHRYARANTFVLHTIN